MCANECVSASMFLLLFLWLLFFCLFCPIPVCLFLFYYNNYYLDVCFLIRKKKMYIRVGGEIGGSGRSGKWGGGLQSEYII